MMEESSKTVWMISGNKGGVGKSLFCKAFASVLANRGELFAVFDGDGRTPDIYQTFKHKVPARVGDFRKLRPESNQCSLDLIYEKQVSQLLNASPHLIVNTPDGADSTLKEWFDLTLKYAEEFNVNFRMIYLISDRPDGIEILPELAKSFKFIYPVRNLYFGKPELFKEYNENFATMFHGAGAFNFPTLRKEEVRILFELKSYPSELLRLKKDNGMFAIPALNRARIHKWMRGDQENDIVGCNDLIETMFDNSMPTLKVL